MRDQYRKRSFVILGSAQRGFSLVSAIFLLVVLSALGAAMVSFSTSQQQTQAMDILSVRAYQAARAGVEWGAYQALRNGGACAANTTLPTLAGTLADFNVTVSCAAVVANESSTSTGIVTIYNLTATALRGTPGQADYVERQIHVALAQ